MFELQWPWLLFILPLPLLVYRFAPPANRTLDPALHIPFYQELATLAKKHSWSPSIPSSKQLFLLWLVWGLLILAACRPVWLGEPIALQGNGRDLMMAVDLSGSMEINDMELNGQQVDRLVATKAVMNDFIERRQGDRIGLILFGSQAYLQAPLTFDRQTIKTLMTESNIGMAGNKTAIGDALGLAVKHLRKRPEDSRVLILLTDGANTAGEISPIQAAQIAREERIKIYSIGLGAEEMLEPGLFGTTLGARKVNPSADLDEKTLTEMATLTGGRYFRARNIKELDTIYKLLDELEPVLQDEEIFRPSKSLFFWPLALALLLSLIPVLQRINIPYRRINRRVES